MKPMLSDPLSPLARIPVLQASGHEAHLGEACRILEYAEPDTPETHSVCIERLTGRGRESSPYSYTGTVALAGALEMATTAYDFEHWLAYLQMDAPVDLELQLWREIGVTPKEATRG